MFGILDGLAHALDGLSRMALKPEIPCEGNADQNPRLVVLRVNNTYGIFRAVESGLGIASLPDYLARESTKLEMLLPDLNVRTTDVYFTYPEELRHSKRIAVFRDFLLRKVAETRF